MTNQMHHLDHKLAYSVEEAADMLSVKRDTVYELINSKQLGSFKIGARRLVARQHLEDFVEAKVA